LGLGSEGLGGGNALATGGGSFGTGWNNEHPAMASALNAAHKPKPRTLRNTDVNRADMGSIYNKVGRSGN
jgi:hypothetical protein